jgi:superfamily I DNA/RNA helicase
VGTPFDTVIIDEGQDMRPHWLASIEQLIDPAGPARLLMVADPAQAIYVDPWVAPPMVVTMPLETNLRSARTVAEVVRHLGGPPPLPGLVGQMPVRHYRAGGIKEVRKRVRAAIDELTGQHGVPLSQIAVLTLRVEVRDLLLDGTADSDSTRGPLPLARWEQRDEDAALCETVHRGKGLERAAVVLVDITDAPEPQLVYIGASRAMWSLTLVGTDHLAAVAGVPAQSGT